MASASVKDIICGLVFIGLAAAFGFAAAGYEIGTALRMGPGYFPLVLASALGLIGALIVFKGFSAAAADDSVGPVPWRAVICILGAIVFFGATVRGLGLGPSLFVTTFLAALASRQNSPLFALMVAAAMTILCLLIFVVGLSVPVPPLGPWVR
jgi:hypothetical protein